MKEYPIKTGERFLLHDGREVVFQHAEKPRKNFAYLLQRHPQRPSLRDLGLGHQGADQMKRTIGLAAVASLVAVSPATLSLGDTEHVISVGALPSPPVSAEQTSAQTGQLTPSAALRAEEESPSSAPAVSSLRARRLDDAPDWGAIAAYVAAWQAQQLAAYVQGVVAAQRPATHRTAGFSPSIDAVLECIIDHESRHAGLYKAVHRGSTYNRSAFGAFQFQPPTWNTAARYAGRPDLVGVRPDLASPADQRAVAAALYRHDGIRHWIGQGVPDCSRPRP